MSDGGITVLDGTHLRSINAILPDHLNGGDAALTGAQLLDFADSEASQALFGLSLPQHLKCSALKRLNLDSDGDGVTFRSKELTKDVAVKKLNDYLAAMADELRDNPLVVSILDGNTLRMFLEDEDDFAMIAENLFTDLDADDNGKISKSETRNAVSHMGVEMGVPPPEEFPLLNDILKKHGAEGEGELGQSQFAELLQPILQDIADALAEKHVTVIHNIRIINGSRLRKILSNEEELNVILEKILQEKHNSKDGQRSTELIRSVLEKNGKELGLPLPSEGNEAVVLLYDAVLSDLESGKGAADSDDDFRQLVLDILGKFAEQLEANPVFWELDS